MSGVNQGDKGAPREGEDEGPKGLTLRSVLLTLVFSIFFSVATIYTLVVLSFSMGIVGVVSVILASSASIWGVNATTKNRVKPPSAQELAGLSWLSSAFTMSLGTTIVIGGVLLMGYILPTSTFSSWQRWWFAPAQSELGNFAAWLPTILFWMLIVFVVRLAVIGIGLRFKQRYIDTDELPFPVAEGQADVIKELTFKNEPPTPSLRYFLAGVIFALVFSLVVEHDWDYPLLTPLVASAAGTAFLVGGMNNAFPWRVGTKLPRGLNRVAYYFGYAFLFIGVLGLISCIYAPVGSFLYYLRFGFPAGGDSSYLARFVDLSFLVPQLSGLGFGVSISILLFVIGYLIPADSSSGMLLGSFTAFILIPLGFVGLTGSLPVLLYDIDSSLILAALLCATVIGSAVIIARTILSNREGARLVILRGTKALYTLGEGRKARTRGKGFQRLSGNVWAQYLLIWAPLTTLSIITILIVGMEPGAPWYLLVLILLFTFAITPLATTLGTWVASRTTRMPSQSPLPFLYEATLFGTGVRELSPYAFGAPVVWQAPGLLSQLRVARLTKTESRVVYLADIIGFPILGVMVSFLVCIWVFSAIGIPGGSLTPPGGAGSTPLGQWNFNPIWNALYTFIVKWLAQGGGAFPYQCNAVLFFLLPLIMLAAWTILHGFRRIPIASTAGIAVGFAVLPYIAITIFLGALSAAMVKRLKGIEWFSKYGITLGAGIYAGASIAMFLIVLVAPLIP